LRQDKHRQEYAAIPMKMQTKFNLGILVVFAVLAAGIAFMSVDYVNNNTISEAENRVRIYARAAWEIHNSGIDRLRSAAEVLAEDQVIKSALHNLADPQQVELTTEYLETFRRQQEMDILNLLTPDGQVILRTRSPYSRGDSLIADPMIRQVMSTRQSSAGNIILELERLDLEGVGLVERCIAVGGEPKGILAGAGVPVLEGGELIGIIQAGSLLNGAVDEVDRIRDAVFVNEFYDDKPVGTATVFMGDMRISTNVMDAQGRRAVGTRVSKEVADRVLVDGLSWTGRAYVVDRWYLSQYDPIRDPDGTVIGILYVGELEQKYLDMRTRAVASYLAIILAAMGLAFAIFFFVIRSILNPVRKLSEATDRLSKGDLTSRVVVRGKDEIASLSASFNHMAERLEKQRREIARRQSELEALSSELGVTNNNYMEMLGFVSHELKNPLTSAIMSLYTVKDGYLGEINPAQEKSLESAAQSLDYFHEMIRNYLDLSRLEKGEVEARRSWLTLKGQVIQPIVDGLQRQFEETGMRLSNNIPESLSVSADPNLLQIVYDNLLSNALKYGRPHGSIVLDAFENSADSVLSVLNDSEGIPAERLPELFGKFSRLDGPTSAGKRGTGLGLYICREIIEKHGGRIWADSKAGEWVKFSFTIPKDEKEK
jgi:two-component system NtrC family sensor kinase